jgi:hypothetical protein
MRRLIPIVVLATNMSVLAGSDVGIDAVTKARTGGESFSATGGGKEVSSPQSKKKSLSNEETAIYNHLLLAEQSGAGEPQTAEKETAAFDIAKARKIALEAERKAAASKAKAKRKSEEEKTLVKFVKGYCYLHNDVVVERIATYANLDCDFPQPLGRASLSVSMTPEFYAKALVANPLYVVKDNVRLPVLNGVVMTKDQNSINLANVVNDRLLKKILATGTYRGIGVAAQQAQAYLNAYQESLKHEQAVVLDGNTTGVVTTTNTEKPSPGLYAAMAGVQFISEMAKIVGENFVRELPFTFKAFKGSVYYVDLQFAPGTHLRGYTVPGKNLVKQEPEFEEGILQDRKSIDPILIEPVSTKNGASLPPLPASPQVSSQQTAGSLPPLPGGK